MSVVNQATANQAPLTISFRLLGGLTIAFLLGFVAHSIGQNITGNDVLTFSTPELINFVLSVVLSGASTLLAVAAIALGKFSEQAMIQRSDESIRIQNEVFQKTTEALQRIESSTGVTEKRIEDIISGRVGDISQKIARIASEEGNSDGDTKAKDIEEIIRRSLMEALAQEGVVRRTPGINLDVERLEGEVRARSERDTKYQAAHQSLLTALSMRDDMKAVKMGLGKVGATGDDLFDGIYVTDSGKKIGVLDFSAHHKPTSIRSSTYSALMQIQNGNIGYVYIFVFGHVKEFVSIFEDVISVITPEIRKKFSYIECPEDKIGEVVSGLSIPSD